MMSSHWPWPPQWRSRWRRHGAGAQFFEALTTAAIGLLFFLQGVRLSRAAIVSAVSHWRLHLVIFAATFVLFPLAGLALKPLASALLAPPMASA
jgi:sodium/bile acid cotransporter 7